MRTQIKAGVICIPLINEFFYLLFCIIIIFFSTKKHIPVLPTHISPDIFADSLLYFSCKQKNGHALFLNLHSLLPSSYPLLAEQSLLWRSSVSFKAPLQIVSPGQIPSTLSWAAGGSGSPQELSGHSIREPAAGGELVHVSLH